MPTFQDIRKFDWAQGKTDGELIFEVAKRTSQPPALVAHDFGLDTSEYEAPSGNTSANLQSGWANYKAGLQRIPAALGSETAQSWADENKARAEWLDSQSTSVKSYKDINNPTDLLSYAGHLGAQSLPYAAEFAATGGLGGLLSKGARSAAAAAEAAGDIGARKAAQAKLARNVTAAGVVGSYPSSLGDVLGNQYDQAGQYNVPAAAALAVPYAAANAFGPEAMIARGLVRGVPRGISSSRAVNMLAGTGAAGAVGGAQEVAQEVANQYGRTSVDANYDPYGPEAQEAYKESAVGGVLLAGVPGAVGGALSKSQAQIEAQQQADFFIQQSRARLAEEAAQAQAQAQAEAEAAQAEQDRTTDLRMKYQPEFFSTKDFIKQRIDADLRDIVPQTTDAKGKVIDDYSRPEFTGPYDEHRREMLSQGLEPMAPEKFKQKLAKDLQDAKKDEYAQEWKNALDRFAQIREERLVRERQVADSYAPGRATAQSNDELIDFMEQEGADLERRRERLPTRTSGMLDVRQGLSRYNPPNIIDEAINAGVPISGYETMEARNVGNQVQRNTAEGFTPRGAVLTEKAATRMEEVKSPSMLETGKKPAPEAPAQKPAVKPGKQRDIESYIMDNGLSEAQISTIEPLLAARKFGEARAQAEAFVKINQESDRAVQKQGPDESLLRGQEPEMGLQGVGKGNTQPEEVAQKGQAEKEVAPTDAERLAKGQVKKITFDDNGKEVVSWEEPTKRADVVAGNARVNKFEVPEDFDINSLDSVTEYLLSAIPEESRAVARTYLESQGSDTPMSTRQLSESLAKDNVKISHTAIANAARTALDAVRAAAKQIGFNEENALDMVGFTKAAISDIAPISEAAAYEAGLTVPKGKGPRTVLADSDELAITDSVDDEGNFVGEDVNAAEEAQFEEDVSTVLESRFAEIAEQNWEEFRPRGSVAFTNMSPEVRAEWVYVYSQQVAQDDSAEGLRGAVDQFITDLEQIHARENQAVSGQPDAERASRVEESRSPVADQAGQDETWTAPPAGQAAVVKTKKKRVAVKPEAKFSVLESTSNTVSYFRATPAEAAFFKSGSFSAYLKDFLADIGAKWYDRPDVSVFEGQIVVPSQDVAMMRKFSDWLADATENRGTLPPQMRDGTFHRELMKAKVAPASAFSLAPASTKGQSAAELKAKMLKAFNNPYFFDRAVGVVDNESQLPPKVAKDVQSTDGKVLGVYDPETNKVWMIAGNIPAGREMSVFLHEVGVHQGMMNLLGKQDYDALVTQLQSWMVEGQLGGANIEATLSLAAYKRVLAAEEKIGKKLSQDDFNDEHLAYFVEEAVKAGIDPTAVKGNGTLQQWFRRLWAAVKVALRKLRMNPDSMVAQHVVDLAYGAARMELNAAWHGTAADFRRFDHRYMGSGEGAQAFGWGTYLAQKVGIAKGYWEQDVGRKSRVFIDGEPAPALHKITDEALQTAVHLLNMKRSIPAAIAEARRNMDEFSKFESWRGKVNMYERVIAALETGRVVGGTSEGSLMRVDTAIRDEELLDWYKPLSEQSELVKQAMQDAYDAKDKNGTFEDAVRMLTGVENPTGKEMYNFWRGEMNMYRGSDKAASEYLDSIGIKGIKFLDQGSRKNDAAELKAQIASEKTVVSNLQWHLDKGNVPSGMTKAEMRHAAKEGIAVANNTIARLTKELQALETSQTRNIVVFNDKNIHRVFTEVGANPQSRKFSIAAGQAARATQSNAKILTGQLAEYASNKTKSVQYRLMFGHALAKVAEKAIPGSKGYFDSLADKIRVRMRQEENIAAIAEKHYALPKHDQNAVNGFIEDSTTSEKWGYAPDHAPKLVPDAEMARKFAALPSDAARDVVKAVFKYGHESQQRFDDVVNAALPVGERIKRNQMQTPYAPLKRFGDHVVVLTSPEYQQEEARVQAGGKSAKLEELQKKPEHYYVEFTDGNLAAIRRRDELQAANPDRTVLSKPLQVEDRLLSTMDFQTYEKLRKAIGDSAGPKKTKAALESLATQLYTASLNRLHANKSQMRRKLIKGYDNDMMRAFVSQSKAEASLIASLATHQSTERSLQAIRNAARSGDNQDNRTRLANEIMQRHTALLNYKETPHQDTFLRASSMYYLLTSPAYYLTNMTQPFVISLPVVAAKHGGTRAWGQMISAYKQSFDMVKFFTNTTLDPNALKALDSVGRESDAMKALLDENLLNIGLDMELGDIINNDGNAVSKAYQAAFTKFRMVAANVETLNRMSTATAAYRLAYTEAINDTKTPDEAHALATEYARQIILDTHGNYAGYNAPGIMMQGSSTLPMKTIMQFKKFQFIQAGLWAGTLKDAFAGASPEEQAAARATLKWMVATQAGLTGALGVPVIGTLVWALSAVFGDEGEDKEAYLRRVIGNNTVSDLLLHGAPAAMGVDLSNRIGAGNAFNPLPFVQSGKTAKETAANYVLAAFGGAAGAMTLQAAQGIDDIGSGEYWKGLERMVPKGVASNLSKVARFETEGMTNTRGDVVMTPEEIGLIADVSQLLGVPSTEITDRQWKSNSAYAMRTSMQERGASVKKDYLKAVKSGNSEALQEALADWNKLQADRVKQGFKRQQTKELTSVAKEQAKREKDTTEGLPYTAADKQYVQSLAGM